MSTPPFNSPMFQGMLGSVLKGWADWFSSIGAWLPSLTGQSGKYARVNSSETGLELRTAAQTRSDLGIDALYLRNLIHPSIAGEGWKDIIRGGWRPAFFNQQWGGAPMPYWLIDGATDTQYRFEAATGYIDQNSAGGCGDSAATYYRWQCFKVGQNILVAAVWLKLYKVGTSTRNISAYIYTDSAGSPGALIANGTATVINMMSITADTNGQWYRFPFATPPSITANTTYHILFTQGAVDASNYFVFMDNSAKKYPHGYMGAGTSAPVWTSYTARAIAFHVEPTAGGQMLQASGQFDSKIVMAAGNPLDQTACLINDASRVWDGKKLTIGFTASSIPASATLFDMLYGLFHDRVVLTTSAGGILTLSIYTSSSATPITLTGTTDVRTGVRQIMFHVDSVGDGADTVGLYVNGTADVTGLTGQTITFDPLFQQLGTVWLGGGFQVAPAMTKTWGFPFSVLPSADGATWVGTGTEASCASVRNGKLVLNKNGFASGSTGYYQKLATGFSNGSGGSLVFKLRVPSAINADTTTTVVAMFDGTRGLQTHFQEYFMKFGDAGAWFTYHQGEFKSNEAALVVSLKGNDSIYFVNGRLVIDGTGKSTNATANNQMQWGDFSSTGGENADAIYSYVAYYNTSAILPGAANGMALHEFSAFAGDNSAIAQVLYNYGTLLSAKELAGVGFGYSGEERSQSERRQGIGTASTSSSSYVLCPDLECFTIGSKTESYSSVYAGISAAGAGLTCSRFVDGAEDTGSTANMQAATSPHWLSTATISNLGTGFGLHKIETRWKTGVATLTGGSRILTVESKA